MGYGKNLKKAIEQKGWTVAKCARDMQISPQTLYTIIRRDSSVRYTLAVRLADILGVDVAFITKDIPYDMEMLDFADCIDKGILYQLLTKFYILDDEGRRQIAHTLFFILIQNTRVIVIRIMIGNKNLLDINMCIE